MIAATNTTPPTAPPAIAPTLVLDVCMDGVGDGTADVVAAPGVRMYLVGVLVEGLYCRVKYVARSGLAQPEVGVVKVAPPVGLCRSTNASPKKY